jgi:hypothetical protein
MKQSGMNIIKRKYDLLDEHFDEFFMQAIDNMTVEQKELLPPELAGKFLRGAKNCLDTLTWNQKVYILIVILGKKWTLFIEDDYGISYEAFLEMQKGYTENYPRRQALTEMRESRSFFLGDHQLMKRLEYVALQFATNLYKSIKGYRVELNEKRRKINAQREVSYSVGGIMRFVINYEANKFKLKSTYGLTTLSELYALMFFYDDEHKVAKYHEMFVYAYSTSRRARAAALARLLALGYMDTRSKKRTIHSRYYLTPKGRELMIKIMDKVFFNY